MARDRASRPEAAPWRLFAAVDIPPSAKDVVVRAVDPWRERLPGGRWVHPENWHITVKFLGRTWPRLVGWVREACGQAAAEIHPFRLALQGFGVFPGRTRARVLWVGLRDKEGSLAALASALDRRLEREFPPEKRAFSAHLTVARFNPPIPFREHAEALQETQVEAGPFRVGRLVLYRSHLSPRGARYEPLETFSLRG
jgi:2'-5' RNA ligase